MTYNSDELTRCEAFKACPILQDYISTALQDLQFSENDEARDTGTIYNLKREIFDRMANDCKRFMQEMSQSIAKALELDPGQEGLQYSRYPVTYDRIGSTLWLARCGHGVTFTDDGNEICLHAMTEWARSNRIEGLLFGDDGAVYHM